MKKIDLSTVLIIGVAYMLLKSSSSSAIGQSRWHQKDDLLRGITYEDLIITVQSNEPEINEASVRKVYREILNSNLHDAQVDLKDNMSRILKEAKR